MVLARLLDDATFATLNNIICSCQSDILEWFELDPLYLKDAVALLGPGTTILSNEELALQINDALLFFLELSLTSKMQHASVKTALYQKLAVYGVFSTFSLTLSDVPYSTNTVKSSAILLLINIMEHEPYLLIVLH